MKKRRLSVTKVLIILFTLFINFQWIRMIINRRTLDMLLDDITVVSILVLILLLFNLLIGLLIYKRNI